MLRNLNGHATDTYGKPIEYKGDDGETKERSFCWLIVGALGYEVPGEGGPGNPITGSLKIERYALALKLREMIGKDEDVELSDREVALIKQAIEPKFTTMVVGPLFQLLEAK